MRQAYEPIAALSSRYRPLMFWYAAAWCALTFFNLTAGGHVTSNGAGLSVPDWPTSYGYNMFLLPFKYWTGGIFYEHGHRLVATTVGIMTIGIAVMLQMWESRRWMRRLGWIALVAVCVQGALGGITVIYMLPTAVSVSHAGLAQLFFCLAISMTLFLSRGWMSRSSALPDEQQNEHAGLWKVCAFMAAVVYAQILLGAVMRHTDSGLAITDFPTSHGRWIPPLDDASIEEINYTRRYSEHVLSDVTAGQIAIHFAHRANALTVIAVVLFAAYRVFRASSGLDWLRRPMALILVLIPIQITLGAITVLSLRWEIPNTAHVVTGAAILATSVGLTLRCRRTFNRVATASPQLSAFEVLPA